MLLQRRHFPPAGGSSPLPPPDPPSGLLGVGSESESLISHPRIANETVGDWYVDASVSSSGDGTSLATAFKTLQEGLSALQDGQTLLVKAGTYYPGKITRNTAWSSRTRIMGYGTDRPRLDFTGVNLEWPNRDSIVITSTSRNELWHRFYITNGHSIENGGSGFSVRAPTTILSDIWASHFDYRSFTVSGVSNGKVTIQDCVGWRMGDGSSQHTDAGEHFIVLGSQQESTPENVALVRCVSINGGDDGYDLWSSRGVLILDSVAIGAGYYWNGNTAGDGQGFKMGGDSGNGRNNRLRGSIAIGCKSRGVDANISANSQYGQYHYINNTCVGNGQGFLLGNVVRAENNLQWANNSSYTSPGSSTVNVRNSWDLGVGNPNFGNVVSGDYSLLPGSGAIGVGTDDKNLGASEEALKLAKLWLSRDISGYAQAEWDD